MSKTSAAQQPTKVMIEIARHMEYLIGTASVEGLDPSALIIRFEQYKERYGITEEMLQDEPI